MLPLLTSCTGRAGEGRDAARLMAAAPFFVDTPSLLSAPTLGEGRLSATHLVAGTKARLVQLERDGHAGGVPIQRFRASYGDAEISYGGDVALGPESLLYQVDVTLQDPDCSRALAWAETNYGPSTAQRATKWDGVSQELSFGWQGHPAGERSQRPRSCRFTLTFMPPTSAAGQAITIAPGQRRAALFAWHQAVQRTLLREPEPQVTAWLTSQPLDPETQRAILARLVAIRAAR